jgi:hypothetical protein
VNQTPPPNAQPLDPVYVHARREAWIILAFFGVCLAWTVGYCARFAHTPADPQAAVPTVLGVPSWVFWGVALPWLLAGVFSIVFALWGIADDDLGQEADTHEPPAGGEA